MLILIYFYIHMWQLRLKIEYYSIAYFKRITEFDAFIVLNFR